jgi:hypothetical protein
VKEFQADSGETGLKGNHLNKSLPTKIDGKTDDTIRKSGVVLNVFQPDAFNI